MDEAEYEKEYELARQKLEDEAAGKTTTDEPKTEEKEPPVKEEPKPEEKPEEKPTQPDPLEEIRTKLEKAEKALKDTQAWGTKNAQELANLKRESEERKRQAERPAILDENPELEEAIKFVVPQPKVDESPLVMRNQIIEQAHPGIFNKDVDEALVKGILARFDALGDAIEDPLACIREITAEKLAHTEREIGKRFAAESAKAAQKAAMSVPGAGGGQVKSTTLDADLEAANRIKNMSSADFEKERRKVLGY